MAPAPDEAALTAGMFKGGGSGHRSKTSCPRARGIDGDPEPLDPDVPGPLPGTDLRAQALVETHVVPTGEDADAHAVILLSPLMHYLHLRKIDVDCPKAASGLDRSWHLMLAGR
ncbi:hypothetical protein [Stenotrophomonas acidaminiphila]